jgi:hypothetical protein
MYIHRALIYSYIGLRGKHCELSALAFLAANNVAALHTTRAKYANRYFPHKNFQ